MPARDSNNSTWYILRYPADFESQSSIQYDPLRPLLDPTLFYDDGRGVLELLPRVPEKEAKPPSAPAVDVNGEIYRAVVVDRRWGKPEGRP